MQVFRNVELKGVISKDKALDLLGLERSVEVNIKDHDIMIYRDDMEDVWIDSVIDGESSGGTFDELL